MSKKSKAKIGLDRCESPLELALAKAVCCITPEFIPRNIAQDPCEIGHSGSWCIHIISQVNIENYRADLAIVPADMNDGPDSWSLVLEVDGHEFHERTKEQARRDRSRDRFMLVNGINVMRFTGQEVHQDAISCAHEALSFAISLQKPRMDRMFMEFLEHAASTMGFK